jgi:glycerate 2-kinase
MPTETIPRSATAEGLIEAVLSAIDPSKLLHERLTIEQGSILAGSHRLPIYDDGRLYLVAIGKAAPGLTQAAVEILDDRLHAGVCTVPPTTTFRLPQSVEVVEAGHPLPDEGSLLAGDKVAEMLSDCRPEDRLLALISGGGSAMFERPVNAVSLEDLRDLNASLLRAGANVRQINQVRKALSTVKGGGLARLASPASTLALILSDVVGDPVEDVASGPTVLQSVDLSAARAVLERYALWEASGPGVRQALSRRVRESQPIYRPVNLLLGGNWLALEAAAGYLADHGYKPAVLNNAMSGEASELARQFAASVMEAEPGAALLQGGEATVTARGDGRGGPNSEFALAAALSLEGRADVTLITLATDGSDGSTDAAGAIVDGGSARRMRQAGIDPDDRLADNDSHGALDPIGALIRTGPTGTNVNDIVVGLVGEP